MIFNVYLKINKHFEHKRSSECLQDNVPAILLEYPLPMRRGSVSPASAKCRLHEQKLHLHGRKYDDTATLSFSDNVRIRVFLIKQWKQATMRVLAAVWLRIQTLQSPGLYLPLHPGTWGITGLNRKLGTSWNDNL